MPELEDLLNMLSSEDWSVRRDAVRELGYFNDEQAINALVRMLHDPHLAVRIDAVRSLEQISSVAAVPDLLAALHDRARGIFEYAVYALRDIAIGYSAEIPGVRELLNSTDPYIRMAGTYILDERAGGVDAIPGLIDLVRLGMMGSRYEFEYVVRRLTAIGTPAAPAMIALFDEHDEFTTRLAIYVLGNLREVKALKPLRAVLENSQVEGYVQAEAADVLTEIGTPEALEAVAKWKALNR